LNAGPVLAVAAGGALGSTLRYVLAQTVGGGPWAILAINVSGSVVMGLLTGMFLDRWQVSPEIRVFLTTGILGGYTTFSTFSLDAVLLAQRGQWLQATIYVLGSVAAGIAGLALAMRWAS
jgi:CrcB protein